MFSTPERLAARTPKDGVGRFEFLELLVKEFKTTKSTEAKEQVLANLANFAYDPVNYQFLRKLSVIDIFLDQLGESNKTLRQYALGGLCNLALDRENKSYILHCGGVNKIALFLNNSDEDTVLSAITTLMFLVNPQSKKEIKKPDTLKSILEHSRNENKRISNLANIFLQDYCTSEEINAVLLMEEIQNIPVPGPSTSQT
ncbi:unnamed protein product [Bemisia tabaci]|uniref:Armadillo repeat-containing protein 7 n=1 Tax=Bemisia tabaci TaxID=7038 RepID=A0A9P0EZU6_BEMTA|nr:PREDICTED: armadillo repeat-containing protein 7-like [Bemisia tabaci]XP_018909232.1 PREDICTED: armadillo repeat-containing protein 7-like [Bemisia tabaci]CAH0385953.1 unnamed protein product [Bemisia tabaci]